MFLLLDAPPEGKSFATLRANLDHKIIKMGCKHYYILQMNSIHAGAGLEDSTVLFWYFSHSIPFNATLYHQRASNALILRAAEVNVRHLKLDNIPQSNAGGTAKVIADARAAAAAEQDTARTLDGPLGTMDRLVPVMSYDVWEYVVRFGNHMEFHQDTSAATHGLLNDYGLSNNSMIQSVLFCSRTLIRNGNVIIYFLGTDTGEFRDMHAGLYAKIPAALGNRCLFSIDGLKQVGACLHILTSTLQFHNSTLPPAPPNPLLLRLFLASNCRKIICIILFKKI